MPHPLPLPPPLLYLFPGDFPCLLILFLFVLFFERLLVLELVEKMKLIKIPNIIILDYIASWRLTWAT